MKIASELDAKAKEKEAKGGAKKPKGRAAKAAADAPPPVSGVQLGKGSRQLFDFLLSSQLVTEKPADKFSTITNKELSGELSEMTQVKN